MRKEEGNEGGVETEVVNGGGYGAGSEYRERGRGRNDRGDVEGRGGKDDGTDGVREEGGEREVVRERGGGGGEKAGGRDKGSSAEKNRMERGRGCGESKLEQRNEVGKQWDG